MTVSLAVLASVIAILSIWGFSNIKTDAKRAAEDAAQKKLAEYLDSEQIQAKLKTEIADRISLESDRLFADMSLSFAYLQPKDEPESDRSVGEEYPGKGGYK
jgi:hypothetical protein